MVFYLIGLGLGDAGDITVNGPQLGDRVFEPPQFLTCPMAAHQMLSAIQRRRTARAKNGMRILLNRQNGMHTLCLLDIKVKEQSVENLMK
ncbi:hypothetical protein GPALN_012378 [Globodera pallida]|nr:hypothetical protein GPALN_012378 [Globodera pallida]